MLIIYSFAQQASGIYGIVSFFPLLIGSLGVSGDVPLILYGMAQTKYFTPEGTNV